MLLYTEDTQLDAGIYLKEQRTKFRELRNLLNVAQSSLRKLLETPTSAQDLDLQRENSNDWVNLEKACGDTLKNESRDIEVFVWWLAALSHKKADLSELEKGLADFLFALDTLQSDIHPKLPDKKVAKLEPDEVAPKQCENQTRALEQLTGDSSGSGLLNVPLMNFPFISDYTFSDYLSEQKSGKLEQSKSEFSKLLQSNKAEITTRFKRIVSIDELISEIDLFINGYRNKNGCALLGFRFIRDNLKQIKMMYQYFFPEVDKSEPAVVNTPPPENTNMENSSHASVEQQEAAPQTPISHSAPISIAQQAYSREQALEDLNKIAVFFKKTEPHSPIPYLIARAIRWGNMSFSELLGELIKKDSPVLAEISKLTGVDNDLGELLNEDVVNMATQEPETHVEQAAEIEVNQPVVQAEVNEPEPPSDDSSSSAGPLW